MMPSLSSKLVTLSCCAGALLILGACSGDSSDRSMQLGSVVRGNVVQQVSVTGVARGKRLSYIRPGYTGFVSRIHVHLGDKVKEGDPLVRIAQSVDQPASQIFPIRAPFDGVVTQVLKTEGEYVESNQAGSVLRMDDLSEMWTDVGVPEIDIAKIAIDMEARILPNALAGRAYKGVIREISMSAKQAEDRWDRGKVEFPVQIQITDPDNQLRPGMSVVVNIVTAKAEKVLTLPHEYVHRDEDGSYLVDEDDKRIPVETGLADERSVEIKSGAKEGLQVQMVDFAQLKTGAGGGRRGRPSH
jgi:multidrug efflux pump subunit AcrA (membrane-fusion protein)